MESNFPNRARSQYQSIWETPSGCIRAGSRIYATPFLEVCKLLFHSATHICQFDSQISYLPLKVIITHLLHKSSCSPVLLAEGDKWSRLKNISVCVCLCVVPGQCGGRRGQEQVLARCAICRSLRRWWPSRTTRARSTPRDSGYCWGSHLSSHLKVGGADLRSGSQCLNHHI